MHKRYVIMTFARGEYFDGTYKQLNAPLRETAYTTETLIYRKDLVLRLSHGLGKPLSNRVVRKRQVKLTLNG
jgi:hypothetical protein